MPSGVAGVAPGHESGEEGETVALGQIGEPLTRFNLEEADPGQAEADQCIAGNEP